jgi:hypothetical protein
MCSFISLPGGSETGATIALTPVVHSLLSWTTGVGIYGANTGLIALLQWKDMGKAFLLEGVTHTMIFEDFIEQMLACGLRMT